MKIKLSKSQWEEMGKKAGWSGEGETDKLNEEEKDAINSIEKLIQMNNRFKKNLSDKIIDLGGEDVAFKSDESYKEYASILENYSWMNGQYQIMIDTIKKASAIDNAAWSKLQQMGINL